MNIPTSDFGFGSHAGCRSPIRSANNACQPRLASDPKSVVLPRKARAFYAAILACAILALAFTGCGTQKQTFNAPDPARVLQATRKLEASQKAAHDSHKLAQETHRKEREAVKRAQANADAIGVSSLGAMQKLDQLALVIPDQFKPAVAAIHTDVEDLLAVQLILNSNLAAAWANSDETEKHLSETETHLEETDANVVNLKEEHKDYYSAAQDIADKATEFNHQLVTTEGKLSWYRWHFWLSWIALGAGILACGLFAFIKVTGKSLFGLGAIAAKIAI